MGAKNKGHVTICLKKGLKGCTQDQLATVTGLGLRNRNQSRTLENTSAVRGMVKKVIHLLDIVSET